MSNEYLQLNLPDRILMGPGPSDVPDRVLRALGASTVGHLDPAYLKIMDETRSLMQTVFGTTNELTIAVSGTGSAGMASTKESGWPSNHPSQGGRLIGGPTNLRLLSLLAGNGNPAAPVLHIGVHYG